ncbi:MAG: cardiolipin synthase [Erysipelotrichaceae bacterium]
MKKFLNFIRSKLFIIAMLILLQLAILLGIVLFLSEYFVSIYFLLIILSVIMSVYVINKNDNPSYKLAWVVMIMAAPIFGGLIYVLFGGQKVPKELQKRDHASQLEIQGMIKQEESILKKLEVEDPIAHKQANYIWKNADFPIYGKTQTTFFSVGEEKFKAMVEELEKAERFIFLEYFIIEEGVMWNKILEILQRKLKAGLDIRILYDDAGCINKLPNDYDKQLRKMGFKCKVFNPIVPRLAMQMNNRDHRKILIIDGNVGMTGGINLADEYINVTHRFGHWKDCSVMLKGEAVWNFTLMFLQFWNYDEVNKDDYLNYIPDPRYFGDLEDDGYVQPFSDSPTDDEHVGEYTHINMINGANKYIYIATPYLVIDQEMKTALMLAAKNGVDVRILVPHIPDKWYVFALTRSNYKDLIDSGVKVYEYTPGFVHAKTFVMDDKMAIVGTVNMDFRSYYLHYECGVWFYKSKVVMDLKKDYLKTLTLSQEMSMEDCLKVKLPTRMLRAVLNLFSPMF